MERHLVILFLEAFLCLCAFGDPLLDEVRQLNDVITLLSKQLMIQQHFVEERIRTDGDSGIKQIRHVNTGTRSYMSESYSGQTAQSVHGHAETERTLGMGEVIAVLNGVEFRTRHNDYLLRMPSRHSQTLHALEDIPFPPVPPSVIGKQTVTEQIAEMQQYFQAFKSQNSSIRAYQNYFKPVLCYLEGAWFADSENFTEPFPSDKHHVEATSWSDLQEKILYTAASGHKNAHEDFSFLPSTVVNFDANHDPVFAQWNYRILCHPIQHPLGLEDLYLVDDLGVRISHKMTMEELAETSAARFAVSAHGGHSYDSRTMHGEESPQSYTFGLLDSIMEEVPGKDNYVANIQDHFFHFNEYDLQGNDSAPIMVNDGFYRRTYKAAKIGNTNRKFVVRNGFSDQNLWISQNSHSEISPVHYHACKTVNHTRTCTNKNYHLSYAIPLEIIWLTPLHAWNPYNLNYQWSTGVATSQGRNGGMTSQSAYNGTDHAHFYHTPSEFYYGVQNSVGVLDPHGQVKKVTASGMSVFTEHINGVGKVRTRYPIAPVHHEGSVAWKELDALKEMALHMDQYANYFETPITHS